MSVAIARGMLNRLRLKSKGCSVLDYECISVFSFLHKVRFDQWVCIAEGSSIKNSQIGRNSSVGRNSQILFSEIGSYCAISWNVTINATKHPMNHLTISAFPYSPKFKNFRFNVSARPESEKVRIGHDVWVGSGAVIMPGIKIGNGAVVGAGSIVTKDVESYAIVAGNPAKLIRYRFESDIISMLERLQWWSWSDIKINNNIDLFRQELSPEVISKILELG